ncbi:ABC transporter permease [Clostridiales bacterium]|nr:ABC transporter permease [Clostridiales bacterium]
MILLRHELRQGRMPLLVWTAVISLMLGACVLIYPEMKGQISEINSMFSNMGSFSAAFGMDQVNFGEFTGYFGIECGNILGLGGAFFASLMGISALAKEEKGQTAEFLLTHPLSRRQVVLEKLAALFLQILILNIAAVGGSILCALIAGESPEGEIFALLFLAYFLLQLEIGAICFGISAFISKSGLGMGLGVAALFYFLNLIANLTEEARSLKYITPFGYTEGADIVKSTGIEIKYLAVGMVLLVAGVVCAFHRYGKKDMA